MSTQSFWIGRPNQYMSDADFRTWVTRNWPKQLSTEFLIRTGTFTDNSPGAGSVAWSGVVVEYGNAQYRVADGNTANTYLYWEPTNTGAFTGTNTIPDLSDTLKLVGTNISGTWSRGSDDTYKRVLTALTALGTINPGKVADSAAFATGVVNTVALADEAVTLKKRGVLPESLCPDPLFKDITWWSGTMWDEYVSGNGWRVADAGVADYGIMAQLGSSRGIFLYADVSAVGTARRHVWSSKITFSGAGQVLRFRARAQNYSPQYIGIVARFTKVDASTYDVTISVPPGASTATVYEQQGTIQADTKYVEFIIYNNGTSPWFTDWAAVSEIKLDVAANAYLLEDNCVIGSKVLAGEIVASKCTILTLSSLTADLGTITSGTVTGATIQTAGSGVPRMVMNSYGIYSEGAIHTIRLSPSAGTVYSRTFSDDGEGLAKIIMTSGEYPLSYLGLWVEDSASETQVERFYINQFGSYFNSHVNINNGGFLQFTNLGGIRINDIQVLGSQRAAVDDADATTIVTQFNTLLSRLRSHGLIAT